MTGGFGFDSSYAFPFRHISGQKGNSQSLGIEVLMGIPCSGRLPNAGEWCHEFIEGVETTDLNFHKVPPERILLSCTIGLVMVNERESTAHLIQFTPLRVFCN